MAKKMTAKEKAERAKIKKELQKQGVIPPNKKSLNREKFISESSEEFDEVFKNDIYGSTLYLLEAVQIMTVHSTMTEKRSLQAVGAAKALKIAARLKQFSEKLKSEGRTTYKIKEKYEYIKDIIDL